MLTTTSQTQPLSLNAMREGANQETTWYCCFVCHIYQAVVLQHVFCLPIVYQALLVFTHLPIGLFCRSCGIVVFYLPIVY